MNQTRSAAGKTEPAKASGSSARPTAVFPLAIALASGLLSVLQIIFFAIERSWGRYHNVAALFLGVATLFLAWLCFAKQNSRFLIGVLVLLSAQFGVFVLKLDSAKHPLSLKLLQVAIVVSYAATVISVLLASARIVAPAHAFLLSFSLAVGIFASEVVLGVVTHSSPGSAVKGPEWVGNVEPHTGLGAVYRPYSVLKTIYPDNPRGYFKQERTREWSLRLAGGNTANLAFSSKEADGMRVVIEKVQTLVEHDIQLNQTTLRVKAKQQYVLKFKARADRPRSIVAGFAKGHAPWTNLGLYSKIDLTPEWRSFEEKLVAIEDEENARIHFDLGGISIPVDLSSVSLHSLPGGQSVKPDIPFYSNFVSYKFNALGCRGGDYPIPRPTGTVRLLVLGDSFALGVGVHEEDTFARRLEVLLRNQAANKNSARTYEVINCGVSGYGTREERLFYELFGEQYQPDVILLAMVWNDDMSFTEEIQKGYVGRQPGKVEFLFHSWGKIQDYRYRRPFPDFSKSAEEIVRLNKEIRRHGARLAVVFFRTDSSEIWKRLADQVTKGLQGSGIPILDLGTAFSKHSYQDLIVHSIDEHPNEFAHGIAAQEIRSFLRRENLLAP